MSADQKYPMPRSRPSAGSKDDEHMHDSRHIEEVHSDGGLDTKEGSTSPVDHYPGYPHSGRWAQFREYIKQPDIPDGHNDYITKYPNRWSRIREILKEPAAEFFGTMILIIFGAGVNAQVSLGGNSAVATGGRGDWLAIELGWAAGTALGVWVSGGYSGGHINPAVTLALAVFRDFPLWKVPIYWFSQLMGGLCGAGIIYANYIHAIDIVEGGRHIRTLTTAGIFSTYALDYMTSVSCFFDEFLGTCVLVIIVFAVTDRNNGPPPAGLVPLCLFIAIFGVGASIGMQTAYAINPARDLGPRILTAMVGYGRQVFNYRNQFWIWCPVLGPLLGGLFGALVYDTFFYTGSESILNKPNAKARQAHAHAMAAERAREGVPGVEIV